MEKSLANGERILVCISPSPTNQKVIQAAARMAEAFGASLAAIYIKPTEYDSLPEADKARLRENMRYAEQNGASITTVIGDDIPVQIAEFAHIYGATKIVIGRSGARRRHFLAKPPLTEQIIVNAPDLDVYIIPDSAADLKQRNERMRRTSQIRPTLKDSVKTLLLLAAATAVGLIFTRFGFSESNIITVFILGVLIISVITVSPIYSAVSSLASVLLFNYFFIEPKFSFHTYETEYLVTFGIMLISSLITGTLANRLTENVRQSAREAFRAKVLFDTNQLLQKSESADAAMRTTANQAITLLNRDIVIYPLDEGGNLSSGLFFSSVHPDGAVSLHDTDGAKIAEWVFNNQQPAGAGTEHVSTSKWQYHAIPINGHCYGVIGVDIGSKPLESFEFSVFVSILGECALALEGLHNAAEKEAAAMAVRNEQLRANLLRSISHDIRTPLTSISGNASNLLSHYEQLDDSTRTQIFSDIYDDSEWLIDLTENLLSISRIENGQMNLHLSMNVVSDVIDEALQHIDRQSSQHEITFNHGDELLLARMDPRLIMQVIINLINNAIKNTPRGSKIDISAEHIGDDISISVTDNGPGIPDDIKPHVFEMFYTGHNKVADGRRGLGLGLALCKSIVDAHKGSIILTDNTPSGCCFTFTLPAEEVSIDE